MKDGVKVQLLGIPLSAMVVWILCDVTVEDDGSGMFRSQGPGAQGGGVAKSLNCDPFDLN